MIHHRVPVRRYFLDTEFYEDGVQIELISVALVCDDGREFYAVNQNAKLHLVSEWVRAHVLPKLPPYGDPAWQPKSCIGPAIQEFVKEGQERPEFWAYYADYDWVVLCQLFGTMVNLPKGFPMYCMDLKQYAVMLGNPELPKRQDPATSHHALADARHDRSMYEFLRAYEVERETLD